MGCKKEYMRTVSYGVIMMLSFKNGPRLRTTNNLTNWGQSNISLGFLPGVPGRTRRFRFASISSLNRSLP